MQTAFYERFKAAHPDVKIGQTSFNSLKSYFMKSLKDRSVCCCKYHVELIKLKDAFNHMWASRILHGLGCVCNCQVCDCDEVVGRTCAANSITYAGITMLWQACLCSKPEGTEFYRCECLLEACPKCGIDKLLQLCPMEEFGDETLSWTQFDKVVVGVNGDTRET